MAKRSVILLLVLSMWGTPWLTAREMPTDSTRRKSVQEKRDRISFLELPIITCSPETSLSPDDERTIHYPWF